jgi:hypothetical protein
MVTARTLLTVPLLALGVACAHTDFGSSVTARVLNRPADAPRDASGLRPAEGAKVVLTCPGGDQKDLGTTNAQGELRVDQPSGLPLACSFNVQQPGYQSFSVRVSDACAETAADGCRHADVRAILASSRSGSAGGSH